MNAVLRDVQQYDLHGVRYYRLLYVVEGEVAPREARVSYDMTYADPAPGDPVEVHALLGIVDRVTRREA
jgi:hypothetical protein